MTNEKLIKNYTAGADVAAHRIVKFSADRTVVQATADTDLAVGISTDAAALNGGRCDVVRMGMTEVECGGAIGRGAFFSADANGKAVPLTTTNVGGLTKVAIGTLEVDAVAGDIVEALINPTLV